MSRAQYTRAIVWIADNDEPLESDLEKIAEQLTVVLIADVWGKSAERVAKNVLDLRTSERALMEEPK